MGPIDGDGTVTATVSGSGSFSANIAVVATYTSNSFALSASQLSGGTTRLIQFVLINVTSTGAYSFTTAGNVATYSETTGGTSQSWLAAISQGSGTLNITSLSATKVEGNFNFTAPANTISGATGTKTVSGNFSVSPSNPQ